MILIGDVRQKLKELPDQSVHCVVTSPPYWGLRDYGEDGQIGMEDTPEEFVANLVGVFREVWRVLRDDGTLWLNLGDSYAGSGKGRNPDGTVHVSAMIAKQGSSAGTVMGNVKGGLVPDGLKPKDLVGIPWRVAFALQAEGWYLRQDIIWHKPNPMPESVTDRCTKSHEYIFLLSKSRQYYFDNEAIKEPAKYAGDDRGSRSDSRRGTIMNSVSGTTAETRNKRDVWTVTTRPFKGAHFATFPPQLIEPCILAGCPEGGTVLDPFFGAGTTGLVSQQYGRNWIGCELNPVYAEMAAKRIKDAEPQPKLFT
jgi:DNA modification methylase